MLTHIFMQANRDPTIMIGGFLPLLGAGHRVGKGDTIILESCEYCNSFLNFFPTAAVILDVDADHLDFFKDLQDVERSFRKFASLVPADGLIGRQRRRQKHPRYAGRDAVSVIRLRCEKRRVREELL